MAELKEYCIVRVVKLLRLSREYYDWRVNQRDPQLGDTGTLIDVLHIPNLPDKYVVESSGKDGIPIWMSDIFAEEIEPIELATWQSLCHNTCNLTKRLPKT